MFQGSREERWRVLGRTGAGYTARSGILFVENGPARTVRGEQPHFKCYQVGSNCLQRSILGECRNVLQLNIWLEGGALK